MSTWRGQAWHRDACGCVLLLPMVLRLLAACLLPLLARGAEAPLPAPNAPDDQGAGVLELRHCDLVVRPPVLFRLTLGAALTGEDFHRTDYDLCVTIEHGEELWATDQIHLERLGQLRGGLEIVLAPDVVRTPHPELPATLRIILASADRHRLSHMTRTLPTLGTLAGDLAREQAALRSRQEIRPLPWLWLEQGQEIATSGDSSERCLSLLGILHQLEEADHGYLPTSGVLDAWRDPVDASIQPLRIHHAPGTGDASEAWVLTGGGRAVIKSDWPGLPAQWLSAAAQAPCTVVELYPAGDRDWHGIAVLRAERLLRAHGRGRVLLVGRGSAALAALRLACCLPQRVAGVRLIEPDFGSVPPPELPLGLLCTTAGAPTVPDSSRPGATQSSLPTPDAPDFWRIRGAPSGPATLRDVLDDARMRLCAYARGPFVLVLGTDEHRAAQEDNQRLARGFIGAWAAHAHGLPPLVADTSFDASSWRHHTWILVGNARSNRVLADIARHAHLPVSWDSRSALVGTASYPRAERRLVAFSCARADGGRALVLDGEWPRAEDIGLPLAGLSDPSIGPPSPLASTITAP